MTNVFLKDGTLVTLFDDEQLYRLIEDHLGRQVADLIEGKIEEANNENVCDCDSFMETIREQREVFEEIEGTLNLIIYFVSSDRLSSIRKNEIKEICVQKRTKIKEII